LQKGIDHEGSPRRVDGGEEGNKSDKNQVEEGKKKVHARNINGGRGRNQILVTLEFEPPGRKPGINPDLNSIVPWKKPVQNLMVGPKVCD